MKRAAFVLPDMTGGGAERLTLDLMRGFLDRGASVDLVLQTAQGEFLPMVPEGVRIVELAAPRLRNAIGPLRRYFRTERPDAAIAAMWPLTSVAVLAAAGLDRGPRLVLAEHCPLLGQYAGNRKTLASILASIFTTYRFADAVVAVSSGLAAEIARLAGLAPERVVTVYNPIPEPLRSASGLSPWTDLSGKHVLAVGKLKQEKNFALLLDAFARLGDIDASLAIVGEGGQRTILEARAETLGISRRVSFPGFTPTPGDWYAGADLFVLSSRVEGFGNVLVEAMHCGLPVVATDCPHGPGELLGQGRWGMLVPTGDAAALASAIRDALDTPVDSHAQRARAAEFSVERSVDGYWRAMFGA